MRRFIAVMLCIASIYSCTQNQGTLVEDKIISDFVELPTDLSHIEDSVFIHVDHWLRGAEIIGISEGEHGMNEALHFRNSYIQFMVRTSRIQVIAFESGLIESRLVDNILVFPKLICELKKLTILNLEGNQITEIPQCISNVKSLEELYIGLNKLSTLPKSIKNYLKLKRYGLMWLMTQTILMRGNNSR